MEVIIYSGSRDKSLRFKQITDSVIMRKKLRLMSLHTASPVCKEELEALFSPEKGYLVIFDINYCGSWKNIIEDISLRHRNVTFCILSKTADAAVDALNMVPHICGYINCSRGGLENGLEVSLVNIYRRISTACGGIMTFGIDGSLKVINYSNIYYIETIKQQHRCTIYHKNGTDTMRADISKLITHLDGRFQITRASTIANLSAVKKIEDGLIYFDNEICCSVTAKRQGEIKRIMREMQILMN